MNGHPKTPTTKRPGAAGAVKRVPAPITADFGLSLSIAEDRAALPQTGGDPYNTSGSFDRTKNWARVGKR